MPRFKNDASSSKHLFFSHGYAAQDFPSFAATMVIPAVAAIISVTIRLDEQFFNLCTGEPSVLKTAIAIEGGLTKTSGKPPVAASAVAVTRTWLHAW